MRSKGSRWRHMWSVGYMFFFVSIQILADVAGPELATCRESTRRNGYYEPNKACRLLPIRASFP